MPIQCLKKKIQSYKYFVRYYETNVTVNYYIPVFDIPHNMFYKTKKTIFELPPPSLSQKETTLPHNFGLKCVSRIQTSKSFLKDICPFVNETLIKLKLL